MITVNSYRTPWTAAAPQGWIAAALNITCPTSVPHARRWLQQLSEEEGVLAVLDAASIHKHPLLGQDHMVRRGVGQAGF